MSSDPNSHAAAEEGSDCVFCCEELSSSNYVEYRSIPSGSWYPSPYCEACVEAHFISAGWQKYLDLIAKADCAAALKRVITAPPPVNVRDAGFAECKEGFLDYSHSIRNDSQYSTKLTNFLLIELNLLILSNL
jgi:hypothetical protein